MNVDQDLFSAYAFYAGVVTLMMLVMSPLTIRTRLAHGVFMSSEDNQGRWKEYKVHKTFGLNFKDFLTNDETLLCQAGQGSVWECWEIEEGSLEWH